MKLSNKRIVKSTLGNYLRAMETPDHIYFVNPNESDENAAVKMFNRKRELICDNYFAYGALFEDFESGNYSWVDKKVRESLEKSLA